MSRTHSSAGIASAAVLGVFVACGDGSRTTPTPVGPTNGTALRIEMTAPDSIPPGASVQLTAIVFRSDGSTEDVTRQAQWFSSYPGIVHIGLDGVATGVARGEVSISVRHQDRIALKTVLVVPSGTFKLTGTVTENGYQVGGVRLTVISGQGTELTATTADDGKFVLYGVGGDVRIELIKPGYFRKLEEITVNANARHDMTLVAERQRRDLHGTYSLSISADCGSNSLRPLPDAVRQRTYSAVVTQSGPTLMVDLAGDMRYKTFWGVVEPDDNVRFKVTNEDFYYGNLPAIVEVLQPGETLAIAGFVSATATSTRIEGLLSGHISVTTTVFSQSSGCEGNHRFVMERQ